MIVSRIVRKNLNATGTIGSSRGTPCVGAARVSRELARRRRVRDFREFSIRQ